MKRVSLFVAFFSVVFSIHKLFCYAIIGGEIEGPLNPYAAIVSSEGIATEITGETPSGAGQIVSVAINSEGAGIIGGRQNSDLSAYVALISPSGVATAITGDTPTDNSRIFSVSINSSGEALAGGSHSGFTSPYVVRVSTEGVASFLTGDTPESGEIRAVAINDSGAGIIGGGNPGNTGSYQALVSSEGVASALTGSLPETNNGIIYSAAINSSGNAIIAGASSDAYAAIVSSEGVASLVTGDNTPPGRTVGATQKVTINDSGNAIIGGSDGYIALVSPEGVTSSLSGSNTPSGTATINSVAINSSGEGIIGGTDGGNPYIALVSSSGVTSSISGDTPSGSGSINGVDINDAGVAIVGGRDGSSGTFTPYAVLVSPSGVATDITGEGFPTARPSEFLSVAIAGSSSNPSSSITSAVVPTSFGPGNSFSNSLFSLSTQILSNHLVSYPAFKQQEKASEVGLLADASDLIYWKSHTVPSKESNLTKPKHLFWAAFFGEYAHQKKYKNFSSFDNCSAGMLLAFDYQGIQNTLIGGGAAYVFNYADLAGNRGHTKTHQEFLTAYGSWQRDNFYLDVSIFGGYYQMHNVRKSIANITSTSDTDGWLLSPHLQISTPFYRKTWSIIDPFIQFDWANNWQGKVDEEGASGFNIHLKDLYTSLLRSEIGARFVQVLSCNWGEITFIEKGSWVNKLPFHTGSTSTYFTGSISTFSIEVFSNQTQNLGAAQLNLQFTPFNLKYPYGSINYQGEFGSSFQSHFLSLEIGVNF